MKEQELDQTINAVLASDLALDGKDTEAVVGGMRNEETHTGEGSTGPRPAPKEEPVTFRPGGYGCGGVLLNHNETTAEEEESAELDDLAVEEDAQVVGGRTNGPGQGGPLLNHNETTAEEEESAELDDLAVEEDAQVVGGRTDGPGQSGPVLNHNETTAEEDESTTGSVKDLPLIHEEEDAVVGGFRMLNNKNPELAR